MIEKSLIVFSPGSKDYKLVNTREILSCRKLYDIVKTEIINGTTYYYTLHDEDEDEQVHHLYDWSKSNTEQNSIPGKTLNLHFEKNFEGIAFENLLLIPGNKICNQPILFNDLFLYTAPYLNLFAPPPNTFIS